MTPCCSPSRSNRREISSDCWSGLNLLSRQTDAGDVPQSGDGVQLLTVHKSKGLEWPVVAHFRRRTRSLSSAPRPLCRAGRALFITETVSILKLYANGYWLERTKKVTVCYTSPPVVPKNVLVVTGSVKNNKIGGWLRAFDAMNLGPNAKPQNRDEFVLKTHPHQRGSFKLLPSAPVATALEAAPYIDTTFPALRAAARNESQPR